MLTPQRLFLGQGGLPVALQGSRHQAVVWVDRFVAPTESDLFLLGKTEDSRSGTEAAGPLGGGASGTYGHILQ